MRYPLWAFFFVLVMPMFTAHALLVGKAEVISGEQALATRSLPSASAYWTHHVASRHSAPRLSRN